MSGSTFRCCLLGLILAALLTTQASAQQGPTLRLPPRPPDAVDGSAFLRQIEPLSREAREAEIEREITRGNIPPFIRTLKAIHVKAADSGGTMHTAVYFVTPDYLAVGTNDDFFRVPMTPQTARTIADAADASLITTKMSDDLFAAADLKLEPRPLTKDRDATATFLQHHRIVEEQRAGRPLDLLIAGIKKDVVLTNRLAEKPNRVAIYGWHYPSGKPIQPLYVGHINWHVDYSHGIRLVSQHMLVDDRPARFGDILRDKELSVLVSSEGPVEAGY
jgi:hypothetical protein